MRHGMMLCVETSWRCIVYVCNVSRGEDMMILISRDVNRIHDT